MLPTVSFKKVVQQQSAQWGRSQAFFLDETSTISCYCTQELHGLNFHVPIIDFLQLSRLIIYPVFYYWDVKSRKQKRTKKGYSQFFGEKEHVFFPPLVFSSIQLLLFSSNLSPERFIHRKIEPKCITKFSNKIEILVFLLLAKRGKQNQNGEI